MGTAREVSPDSDPSKSSNRPREMATLGGGCFWCLETVFLELNGVEKVESGYAGGDVPNPTYQQVCTESTGHAEVIQITFDPKVLSFKEILEVFFSIHDPTTLNRQGGDVGSQYRSVILYHSAEQKSVAEQVIKEVEAAGLWRGRLVTGVDPLEVFYQAEAYHQDYYNQNQGQMYCLAVIDPKLAKFRKQFSDKLRK